MSIPLNKTAAVHVEPWYFVQVGEAQMMLTDEQATALFTQLHDLFADDPSLAERIDAIDSTCENWYADVDAQLAELRTEMEAMKEAIGHPEPPLPPESPTEPQTIPPGVTTRDAVAEHQSGRLVTLAEKQEIATAGNPYRMLGQGLTECGLAKLRELCNGGYSVREMAAIMGIPKGSVDFYLSQHDLRADRRFIVAEERAEESSDEERLPASEHEPIPRLETAPPKPRVIAAPSTSEIKSERRKLEEATTHLAASGTPWRASEDLLLRSTMNRGGTLSQAALLLKRSGAEVRDRWVALCKEREEFRSA